MRKILLILMSIVIIGLVIIISFRPAPPEQEIKQARQALLEAKVGKADIYAKISYKKAMAMYDSAMQYWNYENQKLFFLRNFDSVKKFADKSQLFAAESKIKSNQNALTLKENLQHKLDDLDARIKHFQVHYYHLPLSENLRKQHVIGKLYFEEAYIAFKNQDLHKAGDKFELARKNITQAYTEADKMLSNYFNHFPEWENWVKKTIEYSRINKTYCLVIDKYSRECLVYSNGSIKNSYTVEFGRNWIGDKNQQGDKATPEGIYQVTDKKANGNTRYYKALLLNYPNEEDLKRFNTSKKNGTLPPDAKIGSLIEIHGEGGKGIDWTDGCIALKNSDIDDLYKICNTGTRVTIVGSLKSLEELIK
ncbi:MAG: L,D-transpeptidase [Bacteroidales bacterium]|nr:L,D-transpeptidase [Bacteroidales bacterium]